MKLLLSDDRHHEGCYAYQLTADTEEGRHISSKADRITLLVIRMHHASGYPSRAWK